MNQTNFSDVQQLLDELATAFANSSVPTEAKNALSHDFADLADKAFEKYQPKMCIRFPESISEQQMQQLMETVVAKLDFLNLLHPDIDISFTLANGNEISFSEPTLDGLRDQAAQEAMNKAATDAGLPGIQAQGIAYAGPLRFA